MQLRCVNLPCSRTTNHAHHIELKWNGQILHVGQMPFVFPTFVTIIWGAVEHLEQVISSYK